MLQKAIEFATEAHAGQFRKGPSKRPYITHPLDVVARLQSAGVTDDVTLAAAALHDVIEDCAVTYHQLLMEFPFDVVELVWELTDPPGVTKNTAKARQVFKGPTYSPRAKLIKLVDKTSNLVDVAENPPGWKRESEMGYARSCADVVHFLGEGIHSELEKAFAQAYLRVMAGPE